MESSAAAANAAALLLLLLPVLLLLLLVRILRPNVDNAIVRNARCSSKLRCRARCCADNGCSYPSIKS